MDFLFGDLILMQCALWQAVNASVCKAESGLKGHAIFEVLKRVHASWVFLVCSGQEATIYDYSSQ